MALLTCVVSSTPRYEKGMPLYATHTDFMRIVAAMHGVDYED